MRINKCISCSVFVNCFAHSLNKTDLSKLEKQKIKKIFNKGEIIYTENKSADNIFTLIEGNVKLAHVDDLRTPVILRIAHGNEIIGLEALLKQKNYLITATAETETFCCIIPNSFIDEIVIKNKAACSILLSEVQKDQERLMKHYLVMVLGNSKAKLALALTSLADKDNSVKYLKEEIALMTGLTRETISRMLGELEKFGTISKSSRIIKISRPKELEKLINNLKSSLH